VNSIKICLYLKIIVIFSNLNYNGFMNFPDYKSILLRVKLFEAWDEKTLEETAEFCSLDHFPGGSVVFKNGEDGGALFIVKDGEIAVTRPAETGQEQEIARYIAGDSFGEMDMLTRKTRNAEARAVLASNLLRFPRQGRSIEDFLKAYPAAGARLFDSFLRITAGRIRKANAAIAENSSRVQEMRSQIYRDKLTGLFNTVFLNEQLPSFLKDEPLSLLMVKPDNLRDINDTYGREAGDEVLILMAAAVNRLVRETVEVCRFHGSTFACVFPGMNKDAAADMAELVRAMLNNLDLSPVTSSAAFRLPVSIGIAVYPLHARDAGELITLADELLSIGWSRGGNKILFPEDK
jgi:diguanylate cyclase (GGDEF)-like protein